MAFRAGGLSPIGTGLPSMAPLEAEVLAQSPGGEPKSPSGVSVQTLFSQIISFKGDNLTSCAHVLGQDLVSEGRDADAAILGAGTHPIGEAEQGANHALRGFVEGETLQASLVIQTALDEHLHQSDAEFGLALGLFL